MNCKLKAFKLLSGHTMPLIGFGTYLITETELIREVLDYALGAGYRLIDTATVYGNETEIGLALQELLPKHNLKREDIFITSKLSPQDQGDTAREAVVNSVQKLQCGYLDLYLIHWPGARNFPYDSIQNSVFRSQSWKSLIQARDEGLLKDIGVSNYTLRHLMELCENCYGVKPVVNQVEWHPFYHQADLQEFCEDSRILIQAYFSLGGTDNRKLLTDFMVVDIAIKLKVTPAQVLLQWAVQQNIAIIPKARAKERIEANIDLNFVIPDEEMDMLNDRKLERYGGNPHLVR